MPEYKDIKFKPLATKYGKIIKRIKTIFEDNVDDKPEFNLSNYFNSDC